MQPQLLNNFAAIMATIGIIAVAIVIPFGIYFLSQRFKKKKLKKEQREFEKKVPQPFMFDTVWN
jgi:hypothetical protein